MLSQMVGLHSFLWLSSAVYVHINTYIYNTFSLSIFPSMGTQSVPISWPLYYRLRFSEPWGAYIFSSYFFLSSDKYPEVKLLDPRVVLFFEETSYCFPFSPYYL